MGCNHVAFVRISYAGHPTRQPGLMAFDIHITVTLFIAIAHVTRGAIALFSRNNMYHLLALVVAIMVTLSTPAMAEAFPDFGPLAELVQRTKEATGHPSGTAVAVVKDGKVIYEGYFGLRDIERQAPVTRDTVFYIASATKPFLALNALLKEHDGLLRTQASMQQMFPDVRFTGFDAESVTIKDLLVHTSGIDNVPLVWATAFSGVHDAQSRRRLVAASYPDDAAVRGTFKYTNVGYNILSVWLDEHIGIPWQEQLDNAIFRPLGMQRTTAHIGRAATKGWPLARPYSYASADANRALYLTKSDNTMHAAGGLISTAPDLAKFLLAQLSSREPGDDPALPRAVIERSHGPQASLSASYLDFPRTGYAWGWYTGEYKGRKMLHAFGGFPGAHAHLSFMPDENIGLVVLNNEDVLAARLTNLIAEYVYGVLLQQPDIVSRVSGRFDELHAQAAKLRTSVREQRGVIQARTWNLSQPRAAYAGTYSNALLGDMTIALNDSQEMIIAWGRLTATASGYEKTDHVRVELVPGSGDVAAFKVDAERVESISLQGMEFVKMR